MEIQGGLRFTTWVDYPEPLSLVGLENITSVESIDIGISALITLPTVWIESLSPLSGISGELERFSCSNTKIDDPAVFENITSISLIRFVHCPDLIALPEFPNLEFTRDIWIESTSLENIEIPASLNTIWTPDGQDPSQNNWTGIQIISNPNLETIICESSFDKIWELSILDNPSLTLISGFESLLYSEQLLHLRGQTPEMFDAFHNLERAHSLEIQFEMNSGNIPVDVLSIGLGQNAAELTIEPGLFSQSQSGFGITADDVSAIAFPANLTSVQGILGLYGNQVTGVTGFETLESVETDLGIGMPQLSTLPNFLALTHIGQDLLINNSFAQSALVNLTGLNNLEEIGGDFIIGNPINTFDESPLQSLDGLESLQHMGGNLRIGGIPLLNDISALSGLETVGGQLQLANLASLVSNEIAFTNLTSAGTIQLLNLQMETLPDFPSLTSINSLLQIQINTNLTSISGFENLNQVSTLSIISNPNLTDISCNDNLQLTTFNLTGNLALDDCVNSCICHLNSIATNVNVSGNAGTCLNADAVELACATLSLDGIDPTSGFKAWIDASDQLILVTTNGNLSGILRIYDLTGRIIYSEKITAQNQFTMPLPDVSRGIYFIELCDVDARYTQKVFLKR